MDANAQSSTVTTSSAGFPLPDEQQSSTQISALADADLAEIFKRLPPHARLLASEVCCRWHSISRKEWVDVKHLDLSPIPGPNIAAVIKQCPNLQSVFAQGKCFALKELYPLSRQPNLRSVQLYKCECLVQESNGRVDDAFAAVFSEQLRSTAWQELDLCDLQVATASDEAQVNFLLQSFPASILRLQLSGLQCARYVHIPDPGSSLARLQPHLECLIIASTKFEKLHIDDGPDDDDDSFFSEPLSAYGNFLSLRELFVGRYSLMPWDDYSCGYFTAYMPGLEVLFLYGNGTVIDEIVHLVTGQPRLRILVLADFSCNLRLGPHDDNTIPTRRSYPNGHNAEPLPLLNVFVGRSASRELRFTPSAALRVFLISEPMPQFLEKEEIKPIFEGVWIAEKIKEAARRGEKFWHYEHDTVKPIRFNSAPNWFLRAFLSVWAEKTDEAKPKSVAQSSAATSATQGKRVKFNDVPSFCEPAKIMTIASYPQTEGNPDVMNEKSEDSGTSGSSTCKAKGNVQNGKAAKKIRSNQKVIDSEEILTTESDGSSEDASDESENKSQELGMSTEMVGCDCKKKCLPETCFCALNGIECQIEMNIGCKCTARGCKNPGGRHEYDYHRIRNANRRTLKLLEGDRRSLSRLPSRKLARMRID